MKVMKDAIFWFGIPIWSGNERPYLQAITTNNWNKFHESIGNRKDAIIKNINLCKDKKTLEILRQELLDLDKEQEEFRSEHVICG